MKKGLFFLIIMSGLFLLAETIYVPDDYPAIQEAINASEDSDLVLVSPGTYFENISFFGKAITVASLYYTTQEPGYISDTVINGGGASHVVCFENGETPESVLTGFTITNGNASCGGGIHCEYSSPVITDLIITGNSADTYMGGGIHIINDSNVQIENVVIENNFADHEGGGIYINNNCEVNLVGVTIRDNDAYWFGGGIKISNSSLHLEDVNIQGNFAPEKGGGICCYAETELTFSTDNRSSVFNNHSSYACDIYSDVLIDVIVDTFTVDEPTTSQAAPIENFSFDILTPLHELINCDIYVSLDGNDLNSGYSAEEPLLTISLATSIIQADSLNLHTVWIAEGTYSPSTNRDFFPIGVPENITISGASMENTILDADSTAGVLSFVESNNSGANNLTITHGRATYGGGIHCDYSSPLLEDLIIENNIYLFTYSQGGGIFCGHNSNPVINNVIIRNNTTLLGGGICCEFSSNPLISNVIIDNNRALGDGGGIYLRSSSCPSLSNVTITNNTSDEFGGGIYALSPPALMENVSIRNNQCSSYGGGIYLQEGSLLLSGVNITNNRGGAGGGFYIASMATPVFDPENRCNIYLNNSIERDNGCDLFYFAYEDIIQVIVDTFTVMNPTDFHACPCNMFSFDIQNVVYEQIDSDLYVSPDGDNSNSGINAEEPFKTILHASMVMQASSDNPHNIYLAEGTYSPLTNEEYFPVSLPSYVSLTGESQQTTILDALGFAGVIALDNADSVSISDITICNGEAENGGGIKSFSSTLSLHNVLIQGNSAEDTGGGIDISYGGSLQLSNVTLTNNSADRGGAIFSYHADTNNLINATITNNFANQGGGIYSYRSDFNLVNSILWGDGPIIFSSSWIPSILMIAHTDLQGGYENIVTIEECIIDWLDGNIDSDPMFTFPGTDFSLLEDSPCIDAGTAYFEYEGEVLVDLDESEYFGSAPDMGAWEYYPVDSGEECIPNTGLALNNYPNPFNPETQLVFNLPEDEHVKLAVYNLKGQRVKTLVDEVMAAGENKIIWDGRNKTGQPVGSGVYLVKLLSEKEKVIKKIMLMK
ncbi:MAG: right-handed parallel beta-helix repeat-containing protein [Candidatus Stygibacter australis]|nr:right-handed parallel beta-helix repeat-containing protein [Candidatus Stygibacter australis]MDP8321723.1 right-handed parallel beta-helix repeat-containing protein [Candidatus Stygibacter australis]